jgi:hypothetical protein
MRDKIILEGEIKTRSLYFIKESKKYEKRINKLDNKLVLLADNFWDELSDEFPGHDIEKEECVLSMDDDILSVTSKTRVMKEIIDKHLKKMKDCDKDCENCDEH